MKLQMHRNSLFAILMRAFALEPSQPRSIASSAISARAASSQLRTVSGCGRLPSGGSR